MDQQAWTQATVDAFAFFGGAPPARLVPDNLKTGVDRPDLYDPQLNRSFGELAEHYGVLVDPARSRKPRDKPRVERPMPYVRDSFWRDREFTSLAAMQTEALRWCDEVAGTRACRPLDGAAPGTVFAAVEQPALVALPVATFELAAWCARRSRSRCRPWCGSRSQSQNTLGLRVDPTYPDLLEGKATCRRGRASGGHVQCVEHSGHYRGTLAGAGLGVVLGA